MVGVDDPSSPTGATPADAKPTPTLDLTQFMDTVLPRCELDGDQLRLSQVWATIKDVERELGQPLVPLELKQVFEHFLAENSSLTCTVADLDEFLRACDAASRVPAPTNPTEAPRTPVRALPGLSKHSPFASRPRTEPLGIVTSSKRAATLTLGRTPVADDNIPELDGPVSPLSGRSSLGSHTGGFGGTEAGVIDDSMFGRISVHQTPAARTRHSRTFSPDSSLGGHRLSDTFSPSEINDARNNYNFFRSVSPPRNLLEAMDQEALARAREQSRGTDGALLQEAMVTQHREELAKQRATYTRRLEQEARTHEAQVQAIQDKLDDLRAELHAKQREVKDLQKCDSRNLIQISVLETQSKQLASNHSNLQAEYQGLKTKYEEKCEALRFVQRELAERSHEAEFVGTQLDAIRAEHDRMCAEREHLDVEVQTLRYKQDANEYLRKQFEDLDIENQELKQTVDQLRAEIETATAGYSDTLAAPTGDTVTRPSALGTLQQELAASGHGLTFALDPSVFTAIPHPDDGRKPAQPIRHWGTQTETELTATPQAELVARLIREKTQLKAQLADALDCHQKLRSDVHNTRESQQLETKQIERYLEALRRQVVNLTVTVKESSESAAEAVTSTPAARAGLCDTAVQGGTADADIEIDLRTLDLQGFVRAAGRLVQTLRTAGHHVKADLLTTSLFNLVLDYAKELPADRSMFLDREEESSASPALTAGARRLSSLNFKEGMRQRRQLRAQRRASIENDSQILADSSSQAKEATPPAATTESATKLGARQHSFTPCQITTFILYTLAVYFLGYLTMVFTNHSTVEHGHAAPVYRPPQPPGQVPPPAPVGSSDCNVPVAVVGSGGSSNPADAHYSPVEDSTWSANRYHGPAGQPILLRIQDPAPPTAYGSRSRAAAHAPRSRTADIFMYWLETLLYNGETPKVPT
ncbi:hypothetical protein IWQ60_002032 [Tieghemiomyces parasiticus]|uniref:Uncharacterized protein n=1 Tax=Tieghemiomyces parasiticus TaxID=78921 RepID=A0A9W8E1D0_9FUNG|nr:hypothetical protein IWQ60_002032 [Tieghemiomyces parasiticus]